MEEPHVEEIVLELHDISLLLNYERASTEPRFRHTKLREVTTNQFSTIRFLSPEWEQVSTRPKIGFVFDRIKQTTKSSRDEPDLPSNMLPRTVPATLSHLSAKELETYYWQARNHDGCFTTVTLFQHFIDLFPESTQILVRRVDKDKALVYSTLASDRLILEMDLHEPRTVSMSAVLPDNMTYLTGDDPTMVHAVLGFGPPDSSIDTILDLASLQFGDVGRGNKGRSLFVLESISQYTNRLEKFAKSSNFNDPKLSQRIRGTPRDDWLRAVAQSAKERWEKRATVPWCGHCGAPPLRDRRDLKKCSKCKAAWYCDADHQIAAWTFHKHFCKEVRDEE
jgi:MYND finger